MSTTIEKAISAKHKLEAVMKANLINKKSLSRIEIIHENLNAMIKEAAILDCADCHAPGIAPGDGVCKICKESK